MLVCLDIIYVKECTTRGPRVVRGKPGCGPPHSTQNVFIINYFFLNFIIFQLKVGYKCKNLWLY